MAFNFDCELRCYEYRGERSGRLDDGGEWYQLVLEKPNGDAQQVNVSVPKDLWEKVDVLDLRKGDILNLHINASAGTYNNKPFSRLRLIAVPEIVNIDEDGTIL